MRTYYIYKATNKINGKSYVGQTCDFHSRVWQHQRCYEKKIATFIEQLKNSGLTTSHGKSSKRVKAKMEPVSWKSITLKNLTPIEMAII